MSFLLSYQVPKEVGKVGVESATFIEPISQRKDGIQAMFAKQTAAAGRSDVGTSMKRKRVSAQATHDSSDDDVEVIEHIQPKAKVQKMNTWEDDSEIELVDSPGPSGANSGTHRRQKVSLVSSAMPYSQ